MVCRCPIRRAASLAGLLCCIVALSTVSTVLADRVWWDGSVDSGNAPPGKLLSENDGYWGESVLTGVEYTYEQEPTNPADIWKTDKERFGRRLLDGRPSGNWWVPVGVNHAPVVVIFDFKRPCVFREVDVSTRSKKVGVKIECRETAEDDWAPAFERGIEDSPDQVFHRIPLPNLPEGRYLRLSVRAAGISWLEEVLVWGEGEVSDETPEYLKPTVPTPVATEIAFSSIPGIKKTTFSDAQYWDWQRGLGDRAQQPGVWSRVPTWDSITHAPLLPDADAMVDQVTVVMARNETECVAVALTNTSCQEPRELNMRLGRFMGADAGDTPAAGLTGKLRVAGAIPSRLYGVNLGPLFEADNRIGGSLMQRYLTNGAAIRDFPKVRLSPAGSAVFWLQVTSDGTRPGVYEAKLSCGSGADLRVRVRVVDVTLPAPPVWLNTWSGTTGMFPFVYGDRAAREVAYKQSLGITVWNGFPEPGTDAAIARETGRTIHHVYGMPRKYVDGGYAGRIKPEDLTKEDEVAIAEYARGLVDRATELGLTYDDWYVELWDEPGKSNSLLYGALAGIIRQADPRVRIYCNPCFWAGNGVLDDDEVDQVLRPWYRENVDISVPLYLLLRDRPKSMELFGAPRFVNAFYNVATQSAKSERAAQVELYRRQAWDAFALGWNGWGFYSYYAPRGNPWSDLDGSWSEDRPDYLMVYPGPRGPIPTRASEAVREGWEDYCLLTLLTKKGLAEEVEAIVTAYRDGGSLEELRRRALDAAARR